MSESNLSIRYVQCWQALIVVLIIASLTGCQGLSAAGPSSQHSKRVGTLGLNATSLSFGGVLIGHSSNLSVRASNNGTDSLTISAAKASAAQFSLSAPALPLTIAAGQSATLNVTFTPSAAGNVSGTITIASSASNASLSLSLSGTGVSPGSLTANPASLAFGTVTLGSSQQSSATLTNTGGTSVTVSQAVVAGAGFTLSGLTLPVTLTGGQSTSFTVTFAPQSTASATGSLTITSNSPNPTLTVPLSGTGSTSPGALSANPSSLSFGSVQVGNSQTLSEVVSNTGGSNVVISQDTISGSGFSVSGFTSPLTLVPGQKYTFSAIFAPQSAGSATGNISISSNASNPNLTISLSGTALGAGQLAATPSPLTFTTAVVVGTSANLSASVSATGSSVTVTSVTSNNSEFSLSGLSFPLTIQAGNSAPFTVTFTPQSTGAASGTFTFASNASNGSVVQSLSGTGTAPPVHSVALSWTASSSQNITSYNVYRNTTSGSFSPPAIGSVSAPTTAYTDNSVTDGLTYYYAITAVDSSNRESAYSTQVSAAIPPP